MICDPSIGGKLLRHKEAFGGGVARLSFDVPQDAGGRALKVKVTIRAAGRTATRVATFRIHRPPQPSVSIADAAVAESNSASTLSFPVTLSRVSAQQVSVAFATTDGTATAPADYVSASGTITFAPGETRKTIPVAVVGDTGVEEDETVEVELSQPVNATLGEAWATGTIENDDVAPAPTPQVQVVPGNYFGATQDGNYVFLTVTGNRTVTGFRVNDLSEPCNGGLILRGGVDWSSSTFSIWDDGSFRATGSWSGSEVRGDAEFLHWSASLTGRFSGTSATGTVVTSEELNYKGVRYQCTSGQVRWSVTLR